MELQCIFCDGELNNMFCFTPSLKEYPFRFTLLAELKYPGL